jgi:hypothetical protein
MMNKARALFGVVGLMCVAGSASALQYHQWDFTSGPTSTSSCGGVSSCKMVFTANGRQIAVHAYSTSLQNTNGSNGNGISPNGTFTAASLVQYGSGGIGIRNASEPEGTSSPEHASDNKDRYDVLVFEALSGQPNSWDWSHLGIGWAQEFTVNSSGAVTNQAATADLQFFAGGSATTNFTNMCFTGCATTSNNITNGASGFKSLGQVSNVDAGDSVSIPGNAKGRYLVVSGALETGTKWFDAFKVTSVKAPEPHTVGLLAIGVFAMLGFSRSRAAG